MICNSLRKFENMISINYCFSEYNRANNLLFEWYFFLFQSDHFFIVAMFPFQFYPQKEHPKYNRNNKKHKDNQEIETPDYFNFLSEEDQNKYRELQQILLSPENRYARNRRTETLKESFEEIRKFCLKNDKDDWKRCLVCGIIWLNENKTSVDENAKDENEIKVECISINIRQLKIILGKSKSTINGAMSKMGFTTHPTKGNDQDLLIGAMPYFEGKYFEMRQWTIRKRNVNENNKEKETKKVETKSTEEDSISFLSFNDNDNDFKFDDLDINDNDSWFNYDIVKNIIDFKEVNISARKDVNLNVFIPKSNQDSKITLNSLIFVNADSILEIDNLRQVDNMFRSKLNEIVNSCTCYIGLMIMSSAYQVYLNIMHAIIAYEAGRRVPRLTY